MNPPPGDGLTLFAGLKLQSGTSGTQPPPVVAITLDVKENLENPDLIEPIDSKDGGETPLDNKKVIIPNFKVFTRDSYHRVIKKYETFKRKVQEKKDTPAEGRLVDGELKFGDDEDDEPVPERDPLLLEGNTLPEYLEEYFPPELTGKPLEEIDSYLNDKTFVVITKRFAKKYIHRFSATKAFFLLSPWNPLRRAAVAVATNQIFDYVIILTILVNCGFLASTENDVTIIAEYIFLAMYTIEMLVKVTARGFILNTFTYLRDGWNWLDFIVVVSSYLTIILNAIGSADGIGNIAGLRTFRVLRAFKTISIVPGLKTMISALLKSMRMLAEVIVLTIFCMMVFALFALQVYIGILRQKCVKDIPDEIETSHSFYQQHIKDSANWFFDDESGDYLLCGNSTGAGKCPANYTCLPGIGDNPNDGYTNFDHFGWAMLNAFQLITLDNWEDPYDKVIRANGPWNVIFFVVVVFFGSFYLINLMLAVVSMSYEEEASNTARLDERAKKDKKDKAYDLAKIKEMTKK
jgi:hypothetical protein